MLHKIVALRRVDISKMYGVLRVNNIYIYIYTTIKIYIIYKNVKRIIMFFCLKIYVKLITIL